MLTTQCPAELFGRWDFHVMGKFDHMCAQAPFNGENASLTKKGGVACRWAPCSCSEVTFDAEIGLLLFKCIIGAKRQYLKMGLSCVPGHIITKALIYSNYLQHPEGWSTVRPDFAYEKLSTASGKLESPSGAPQGLALQKPEDQGLFFDSSLSQRPQKPKKLFWTVPFSAPTHHTHWEKARQETSGLKMAEWGRLYLPGTNWRQLHVEENKHDLQHHAQHLPAWWWIGTKVREAPHDSRWRSAPCAHTQSTLGCLPFVRLVETILSNMSTGGPWHSVIRPWLEITKWVHVQNAYLLQQVEGGRRQ